MSEEYLINQREQALDLYQNNFTHIIKIDDVVLIQNPIKTRFYWSLRWDINVISEDDNYIRSVQIKKSDDNIQLHTLKYIIPLEFFITYFHQTTIPATELSDDEEIIQIFFILKVEKPMIPFLIYLEKLNKCLLKKNDYLFIESKSW